VGVGCVEGCDLEFTRYPIVLVHGAAPADYLALFQYFYGVQEHLQEHGYLVVAPAVDPFASTEQRCAQWSDHLDALVDDGVGRRFDLIGHSQGGTDARYVTSRLGHADEVAAVISVAGPHRGSAVADVTGGLVDVAPFGEELVDAAVDGLAALLGLPPQDAVGALESLTTEAMAEFNATTPDP
jgi:triacylglycerol lipase